jgi:hypothetical protein
MSSLLARILNNNPALWAECNHETIECMEKFDALALDTECGLPPQISNPNYDQELLYWGFCACPTFEPALLCLDDAISNSCPAAKNYFDIYDGIRLPQVCQVIEMIRIRRRERAQVSHLWETHREKEGKRRSMQQND